MQPSCHHSFHGYLSISPHTPSNWLSSPIGAQSWPESQPRKALRPPHHCSDAIYRCRRRTHPPRRFRHPPPHPGRDPSFACFGCDSAAPAPRGSGCGALYAGFHRHPSRRCPVGKSAPSPLSLYQLRKIARYRNIGTSSTQLGLLKFT